MSANEAPGRQATTLEWARYYVSRGWPAVPARMGTKFPAGEWLRYQTTTPTDQQLVDWFGQQGFTRLGIVTGAASGVIVADFDGETGMETLSRLDSRGFPTSTRQFTPSGGCHVLLKHPGLYVPTRKWRESPWRDQLPGMDIRGDGGFIMAAPSVGAEYGEYAWDVDAHPADAILADAPAVFADLICQSATPSSTGGRDLPLSRAPTALGLDLGQINDGRETYMRNTVLAVTRGLYDSLGRMPTEQEVFEEGWPQYSTRVDLSRAGRGENEFRAKVRYTLARLARGAVPSFTVPVVAADPFVVSVEPPNGAEPTKHKRGIQLLSLAEIEVLPPPEWLIAGLIPEKGIVIPYGPPKAGKTFVVLSMGLHIAAHRDWMGRKVNGGGVVYVAGEGVGGLSVRLRAMREAYQIPANIPFWVVPRAINFRDTNAVSALLAAIKETVFDEPISLVVLDTLARAMPGVDENSAEEVGIVIAACDELKFELGATIMPIHHAGKDIEKGLRGSSAIHGALDASLQITGTGDRVTVKNDNQKDAEQAAPFVLEMRKIEFGLGKSSLVPFLTEEAPAPRPRGRPRSGSAAIAGVALEAAIAKMGQDAPAILDLAANIKVAPEAAWQREILARIPAVTGLTGKDAEREADRRRKQAARLRMVACSEGVAVSMEGFAWLP